jgi:hypothetical protein
MKSYNKKDFSNRCYNLIKKVPKGKVVTYKQIAENLHIFFDFDFEFSRIKQTVFSLEPECAVEFVKLLLLTPLNVPPGLQSDIQSFAQGPIGNAAEPGAVVASMVHVSLPQPHIASLPNAYLHSTPTPQAGEHSGQPAVPPPTCPML